MKHVFKISAMAIAINAALIAPSLAQDTKTDASKNQAEVIIVTGTPGGIGVRKSDASFAVTNISGEDIERLAPQSTADLFSAIPGVWVESSGGQAGANIFVRGFPGGGDAPFLTISLEGSPIYPAPTLSFLENSSMFRLDETIELMEGLRGGPNPVVSNGQPGLTTNFRLKRGSSDTEAMAKYTISDYGLNRIDVVASGEISDDLFYMMGGYIKSSDGVRDAGFRSEEGRQFTLNITKLFDNGELNLYTRHTNDSGVWYLLTPLDVDGVDANYTQIGPLNRQARVFTGPDNQAEDYDFGDGRGWDGHVSGGSIKIDLADGWQLIDRFSYTSGAANTLGLVPNGGATTVGQVADNGMFATGAVSGQQYDADTPTQQIGRWVVLKDIEAFTNDFALSKGFENFNVAVGLYTANTKAEDRWTIGNHAFYVLTSGGELLDGIACNNAVSGCDWNYDLNGVGDASTQALYATLGYEIGKNISLDFGLRRENHQVAYSVDEGLDGMVTKTVDYDETKTSWTTGINYKINKTHGVFARANKGFKMPYFDDFRDNFGSFSGGNDLIQEVTQAEIGYKYFADSLNMFATFFTNEVQGDTFVRRPGAPAEILTNEAYGVELDGNYFHGSGFAVNLNATIQETDITESPANQGNEAQRQPNWQVRITPSYEFEFSDSMFATAYATITAVDDRFGNNENTVVLDGYEKIDIGLNVEVTDNLSVQFSVDNLTDELALTEGDPRNPEAPNGRYILPRSMQLSVSYSFF